MELRGTAANLRPLWNEILQVYDSFRRVCEKHGLCHYAAYGTALGAVRHKGFIPWDDDFDVMMPRPDYEKFCEVAHRELPDHLRLVTWKNTEGYPQTFGKVQECRKDIVQRVEREVGFDLPQGIYIDVFVLDAYPDSPLGRVRLKWAAWMLQLLHRRFSRRFCEHRNPLGYCAWLCAEVCRWFHPAIQSVLDFPRFIETTASRFPYGKTTRLYEFSSLYLREAWIFSKEVYGLPVFLPFEGGTVPVPHDVDAYLKGLYGDYMTPHPEDQRGGRHVHVRPSPWRWTETGRRPGA